MKNQKSSAYGSLTPPHVGGKLAARFRRMNILFFAAAFCVMAVVMTVLLNSVIANMSSEYADQYAASSAQALGDRIDREIGLVSRISRSEAVIDWMANEYDEEKKALAVGEMLGLINELYSYNLYIGIEGSRNQYSVGLEYIDSHILHIDVLSEDDPEDVWYFAAVYSDEDYLLDIGIDHEINRKRMWVDYKVMLDGVTLGVISTGLEFSHIVGELFAHYDHSNTRGLIIDERGVIHMDSNLLNDKDFLFGDFQANLNDELSTPEYLAVIGSQSSVGDYTEGVSKPLAVHTSTGSYNHITIRPIKATNWSVVILSGGVSLFDTSYFIPIMITVLVLLLLVTFVTSAANYRLVFLPLGKLGSSLGSLRDSIEGSVYGAERDDELGDLSKTIQDLFTKANVDALTGVYNRRFMENNLEHTMGLLSRTEGLLSILMLDIDFFKKYNDTYGHDQGDICLKKVAQALTSAVTRAGDFTARYGGEEFIAVLPNTDENGASFVADKLLERVRELDIPHSASSAAPYVTVSIGVTTGKVSFSLSWQDFIKRADEALYMSKQNGRNKYSYLIL